MYLLAVDPGRRFTGYAIFRSIKRLCNYGTIKCITKHRYMTPEQILIKDFSALVNHCKGVCDYEKETERYMVVEDTFLLFQGAKANKDTIKKLISAQSAIKTIGEQYGFEVHDVPASTWITKMGFKKNNKEKVNKQAIWTWVNSEYPHCFGSEHAISAVCVGYYWMQQKIEQEMLELL